MFALRCQLNNVAVENLSLSEARKQIDKAKDKLQLVVVKGAAGGVTGAAAARRPLSTAPHESGNDVTACVLVLPHALDAALV